MEWTQLGYKEDKYEKGVWRVEAINTETGDCYVAVFFGSLAQQRARQYFRFLEAIDPKA